MNMSTSELSLECKPHQSYSMLLKSFGEKIDQTQNLEEFLARLEEERVKIDAFKRELPLCMQLLTNAMEASRQQLQSHRENNESHRPVLEEFIPLKNINASGELGAEKLVENNTVAVDNKANWMTSAQLWSPASDQETKQVQISTSLTSFNKENDHMGFSVGPKLALDNNSSCPSPTLALASSNKQNNEILVEDHSKNLEAMNINNGSCMNIQQDSQSIINGGGNNSTSTSTQQPHRKARRCWSPDLHRRFVNALQMLGGSQVATPKQIRELMKVDGLTNDEVKSHLQKYRLHTRRPGPSPQATTPPPHLVVLGGIWVPPEYAAAAAHGGAPPAATFYGPHSTSHAPSPHYIAAPQAVTQEFYSTPQPLQSLHHLQHHQQLYHHGSHMFKPPSKSHSHGSPESGARGTGHHGDRSSESIEDGKSESCSSENGGERKVVVQNF
ncbi:myb family transcription factor EFM-like [Lycium ferocissimum]|uniref:myb family transcription factor EFM-like n=1 Tax=Lycium ferocissimum TaxID=112874 RepID=UPI00281619E4|nr:myb family transcription factor EFM-like [Lycium ferocissimum]